MSETPTSSASSASSVPSFVKDLDLHALASLATKTRSGDIDCAVDATPKVGAFNVVYFLEFADGLRWVARIPIAPWSEALQKRMSLDRISLDFIGTNTTMPVPIIIDCQTTAENALGRPYMFMTFLPGTQLAKLWFDPVWFTDEHRNTVFESLARLMSQLSSHEFSSIGQLDIDPTTLAHVVGPSYPSMYAIDAGTTVPKPAGNPCTSTYVYFQSELIHQLKDASDITVISWLQLLRTFTGMLLDPALDGAPFFLSHPDLNYQNILVDEEGNVTGLIDWDDTCVVPRQCAFARYPSWITRDWDPLMYAYREASPSGNDEYEEDLSREAQQEDPPETLARFREEYLAVFSRLDPEHARFTRYSHIIEALEISINAPYARGPILDKLTEYVYGGNDLGEREGDEDGESEAADDGTGEENNRKSDGDDDGKRGEDESEGDGRKGGGDDRESELLSREFLSFDTLAKRLSTSDWSRDTVGAEKLARAGKYNF